MTEPIHNWFELTYSNYLVLHRSILQSMPDGWQEKFVALLEEMREAARDVPNLPSKFVVQVRGDDGRFVSDPYSDYQRGRRGIALRKEIK